MSYLGSAVVTVMLIHLELAVFSEYTNNYNIEAGHWFPYFAMQAWVGLHFLMFPLRKGQ